MINKLLFSCILLFFNSDMSGQDTIYLDKQWKPTKLIEEANYFKVLIRDKPDTNNVSESIYFISGQIKSQVNYTDYRIGLIDGIKKEWYDDGQIRKESDYKQGKLNGRLLIYWNNGKLKRSDIYKEDVFVKGKCYTIEGADTIHYYYETMPKFPGGDKALMKYIKSELEYPYEYGKKGLGGVVILSFIVKKDGSVADIKVLQGINYEFDGEAIRVIKKMPAWIPGTREGNVASMLLKLPIRFTSMDSE